MPTSLEQSVHNTIRYFALFDLPVTSVQVWRALILDQEDSRLRWQGQHLPNLQDVQNVLSDSSWLKERLGSQWGYFFLKGREDSVERRLARHVIAQYKWRLARRLAKWLAIIPCVRMIAGSGSLALSNTRPASDLDVFVIVRKGRIWTARLLLLLVAQLLGRRRKHWDEQAPDRLCFNHFITDGELTMTAPVRNLYTAIAYTHLVPLFGTTLLSTFQQANAAWMRNYLMYPDHIPLSPKQAASLPSSLLRLKEFLERIMLEPLGDLVERGVEKMQRRIIAQHGEEQAQRAGRIVLTPYELAFHPHSQVPKVLRQFAQDAGQKQLL